MSESFARRGRRAPYSQVGDWVVVADPEQCEPPAKALYWALEGMTFRDHDGSGKESDADPSRETLAEMLGYSRPQSIDRYLKQLIALDAIEPIHRHGYPTSYRVHQTPPDDYTGPRSMGEWHNRRRARKAAERAEREAERKIAKVAANPQVSAFDGELSQLSEGYALERTSPDRTYAPDRTGGVRCGA